MRGAEIRDDSLLEAGQDSLARSIERELLRRLGCQQPVKPLEIARSGRWIGYGDEPICRCGCNIRDAAPSTAIQTRAGLDGIRSVRDGLELQGCPVWHIGDRQL